MTDAIDERRRSPGAVSRARRDPAAVQRDILAVAREEFVEKGLSGARVDDIAARTATSKRMIYYYFGDKEGLYRTVLEDAYSGMRAGEALLDLAGLPPREALAKLVAYSFDYHAENPAFVRLVMVENIHHGRHLSTSRAISGLNAPAIDLLEDIYQRGVAERVFRPGLDPLDLHFTITAPAFYNVSNRASIRQVFGHDMGAREAHEKRRASVVEMVLRFVTA
jgi:AcrR family transcriptional regulator